MADMVVDVADAKRLLDAAGYGAGFSAGISGQTAAEQAWIEWGLKQGAQVGIKIVPQVTERTVYLKRQQDHNWDLGQIYGVRAYPDPNDYLQPMFTVGGSKNYGDLVDPVLEGLIKQQLQELNVEKRKQILQDIDRRWTKEFNHATFSFTQGVTSAVAGRLKNYQTRPSDLTQLRYAWLDG